jgi:hemerythrin-like domain-containing protein
MVMEHDYILRMLKVVKKSIRELTEALKRVKLGDE